MNKCLETYYDKKITELSPKEWLNVLNVYANLIFRISIYIVHRNKGLITDQECIERIKKDIIEELKNED